MYIFVCFLLYKKMDFERSGKNRRISFKKRLSINYKSQHHTFSESDFYINYKERKMDMRDFFSSDDEEHQQPSNLSDTGRETMSTDQEKQHTKKTKQIRKQYEPIKDGEVYMRYEDNPGEYRKLRKKIQNRESAARVRGRKRGEFDHLEKQVDRLEKINSQLMLRNATLETENKSLNQQVTFLRTLVQPNQSPESIDKYLNLSTSSQASTDKHYQSPFEELDSSFSWVRSPSKGPSSQNQWSMLFVLTIIVGIFVIPSEDNNNTTTAKQVKTQNTTLDFNFESVKDIFRYLVIGLYLLYAGYFLYTKMTRSKIKKI